MSHESDRRERQITPAELSRAEDIMRNVVMPLVETSVAEGNRPFAAAILGPQGEIYSAHNQTGRGDPTRHAEIVLIGEVCQKKETPYLPERGVLMPAVFPFRAIQYWFVTVPLVEMR